MAAKDIAYGISALSTKLYNKAENDELLVRESDGKMFYKREPNGQIVGYSASDYTDKDLMRTMIPILNESSVVLNTSDIGLYYTFDISDNIFLNENDQKNLTLPKTFPVSKDEHGIFIRVRGCEETNAVVAYTDRASSIPGAARVVIGYEVNGVADETVIPFNTLSFINLANTTPVNFEIKYIKFDTFKTAYATLAYDRRTELIAMNLGNQRLYADKIDIVAFSNTISQADTVYADGLALKSAFALVKVQEEMDSSSGFTMSEDEPDHACLWAKIVSHN